MCKQPALFELADMAVDGETIEGFLSTEEEVKALEQELFDATEEAFNQFTENRRGSLEEATGQVYYD